MVKKSKKIIEDPSFNCGGKGTTYKELIKRAQELKEKRDGQKQNK